MSGDSRFLESVAFRLFLVYGEVLTFPFLFLEKSALDIGDHLLDKCAKMSKMKRVFRFVS